MLCLCLAAPSRANEADGSSNDGGSNGDSNGSNQSSNNDDNSSNTASPEPEPLPSGSATAAADPVVISLENTDGTPSHVAAAQVAGKGSEKELALSAAYYAEALASLRRNPKRAGALFELGAEAARRGIELKVLEQRNLERQAKASGGTFVPGKGLAVDEGMLRSGEMRKALSDLKKELGLEQEAFLAGMLASPAEPAKMEWDLKAGSLKEDAVAQALEKAAELGADEKEKLTASAHAAALSRRQPGPRGGKLLARIRAMSDFVDEPGGGLLSETDMLKYLPREKAKAGGRAPASAGFQMGEGGGPFFSDLAKNELTLFDVVKRKYNDSSVLQRLGLLRDLQVK